jgi:hypothetical protein
VWTSNNSLDDGSYTYSIVVNTITQATPLTGSFKIGILSVILIIIIVDIQIVSSISDISTDDWKFTFVISYLSYI